MLLSSIQIQGFKSFADKTTLKFGKGITAVVGPNGSGKSNISDAVRWVLGEQSTKSLRGQCMEDVIFGGTEDRRPHGFCEVTLNINNTDRTLNFDNDFVSITRRYYRSHEGEYLINNVAVRLKDIHELFMDTGLGRDGYSMIGQGKIDNIISSKSGERRDIFEEASGISRYRYRKIEAERKLFSAEENLIRLKDIMNELEVRVGPLGEQSKKAEKFLELSESKKELEIGLWLHTLNNSKDALRNQESKITIAEMQYKDIAKDLSEFDSRAEQNSLDFARFTGEIEEKRGKIAASNEEIVKKNGDITVIQNDINHNNESIVRLEGEIGQLKLTDDNARLEIDSKRAGAEEKLNFAAELNLKLKSLEDELSSLLSDSESISRKIEDQIKQLNILSSESAEKRVEMMTSSSAVEQIINRNAVIDATLIERNTSAASLKNDLDETTKLLDNVQDKIDTSSNALKGYEIKYENRKTAAEELKKSIDNTNLDIEGKKRRVQILTELENNMEGFSHSVKTVMSQSKNGLIRGIHGTVASIITVKKEHSVAVETALGNAIQNIITDTENDAKRAISFLKKEKGGRATFLPISSITARDFKETGFQSMYGYVGIASELVTVHPKYSEIIKYLLGGAVVTEDIDSAVTIAKEFNYRIKVVSLDGQVINPGGSLTGGSLVRQAGLLSRTSDIERLKEDINKLTGKHESLTKEYIEISDENSKLNADILSLKAEIITANEDKIRTLAELRRIDELKNNTENSISELTGEKKESDKKLSELKGIVNSSAISIAEIDNKKTLLQKEIDNMSGGRDTIIQKREELTNGITGIKMNLIENGKDVEALNFAADNLENLIGSRGERIEAINSEISAFKFKNTKLEGDIDTASDNIDMFKKLIKQNEDDIEELILKRSETEKIGIELRSTERERTLERERIGGELARLTERKKIMIREYDEVIRQLYDEYSLTRSEAENIGIEIEKPDEAKRKLVEIKSKIRGLGNVNVSAIEEYKEVSERYNFMNAQISDIENSRAELHKLINQLTSQMQEIFVEGFNKINENFSKTFKELFGGGSASLTLSDPTNILESGIDIDAKLPGKNVPSLDGLSGGEKALIALSIYFAIMKVNAPPFCFLDEVDTALDDINVDRFADYMKKSDFSTQFICVTHRRGTMEAADMLYGVTMQEKGVTKLLELNVSELEKKLLASQGA